MRQKKVLKNRVGSKKISNMRKQDDPVSICILYVLDLCGCVCLFWADTYVFVKCQVYQAKGETGKDCIFILFAYQTI